MKQYILAVAAVATAAVMAASAQSVATQSGAIRYAKVANVDNKEMIYISEECGTISLNGIDGSQAWSVECDDPAVMFELLALDLDGDNSDDVVAVSGNGSVYAFSSKGKPMWKFSTDEISRLSEIAAVGQGESMRIFAAGNTYQLYELNVKGELISTTPIKGCVRSLAAGNFTEEGRDVLYLHTYSHDKYRSEFFGLIDPDTKEVIKQTNIMEFLSSSDMVNDMEVSDVNGDGKDDILIFSSEKSGSILALDGALDQIFKFTGSNDSQRYAAAKGTSLLPERKEIVMQFGSVIYVVSADGELIERAGRPHKDIIFNDLVWLPKEQKVVGMGQTGGDNSLYFYDATKKDWAATEHQYNGLALEVKENLDELYSQSLNFKMPSYQTKSEKPFVVLGLGNSHFAPELDALDGGEIVVVGASKTFSENTPRTEMAAIIGKSADKRDRRKKYEDDPDDIVAWAVEREAAGEPFQLWVGHGTDPFYIHINTLERIVESAPTTCYGFIYAEMDNSEDPGVQYFINEYMPRLAAVIRNNNAATKLYFRYKNMFWASDVHEPLWKEMFLSGKYSDILVPSAEDTNNRLQDLNLAGRVGMYASGCIDNFAMRLVDDNPTSWRPLSQGGQRSVSQYLRNGILAAAYGSSHGILFGIGYLEEPKYNTLFALIKSGALPMIDDPKDILSIGSWHLIKDADQKYIREVNTTTHNLLQYKPNDDQWVISKAGVHWCGASTTPYDYSRVSLGVEYRWLNFMPPMPDGMVPIAPSEYSSVLDKQGVNYVVSDVRTGYVDGQKVDAESFGDVMTQSVEQGADEMLMRVEGASWALIRVGKKQARLILIDNGYVSPEKRVAKVSLQGMMPTSAIDILSGEGIAIDGAELEIEVPAGSVRFIDLEYRKKI